MAVIISENTIEAEARGDGVTVKHLITPERVNSDRVRTEKLHLEPGAETDSASAAATSPGRICSTVR